MAILRIRQEGDPVLRQVAKPVDKITRRVMKTLKDMEETMYAADGIGLAAPQVGILQRMFVVDVGEGPIYFINPSIIHSWGSEVDREGCLSIPGVWGYVERFAGVTVAATDMKGKPFRLEAEGVLARAIQHELDHLDGVLFIDKATGISTGEEQLEEGTEDVLDAPSVVEEFGERST